MNNQLALKLKIQVTLKDSSFLGLQPSYLVYDIFYKPLYEFNLNGCNSNNLCWFLAYKTKASEKQHL